MEHPTRTSLSHNASPELTHLGLQKFVAIPKSVSQARIQANAQIFDFELDAEDMEKVGPGRLVCELCS